MEQQRKLLSLLEEMVPIFSSVAAECVEMIFDHPASISQPWKVVERLNCNFDHLITMGSANEEFSALIIAGSSGRSLSLLLEEDVLEEKYLSDVLGELLNSYCALLDDSEKFSEVFGKQIQAVPFLYNGGAPFMPFLRGVEGTVSIKNEEIYIGYVLRKNEIKKEKGDVSHE
jgi:hypothetical protein